MARKSLWIFTAAVLAITLALPALAQESAVKGNLGGTVFDSTGAVVPSAKVTLTGPTGTSTANSDAQGEFLFDRLTPGTYAVKVEKDGFAAVSVTGVEVFTGKTSSVRPTLKVGSASEVVEVSAAAVGVDVTTSSLATNLNDSFYESLPVPRNVTGLFYASPGVANGGGTGAANPSISGGTGLENQYVADGVNITDGAFGGIGVYSRNYGSLSTGINLSFVKEVQVKTGGYEPQYGKSTGGIVQIVTKSGSSSYHGGAAFFFGPQQLEATRLHADDFGRLNQYGKILHQGAWDVSGEIGGYVPHFKDKLFFFTSFNPSWTRNYDGFADLHGVLPYPMLPNTDTAQTAYNYAGKLTWKLNDSHQIESSVFGDPTRSNFAPWFTTSTFSKSTFSKLDNGTRNWVVRYNGTLSPTWLVNASFGWGHNYLSETPYDPTLYQIQDQTGRGGGSCNCLPNGPLGPESGIYDRQGLGYYEDTSGDNYSLSFDTQKVAHLWGEHTLSVGYHYERNYYDGTKNRTGPRFTITPTMAADMNAPAAAGLTSNAAGFLLRASGSSPVIYNIPGRGPTGVIMYQTRGEYEPPVFNTYGRYHDAYLNDSWGIGRHVTVNVGWRWEQQGMTGTPFAAAAGGTTRTHYTFTDNWSPRIGLAIDPKGDRKTKVYGNFARYSYAIPLDMAIRSLSNEEDFATAAWLPVSNPDGTLKVNPDGTIANPILDDAHWAGALSGVSSSAEPIASGTRMQYLQEWVAGVEHEFPKGITMDVRWQDRRLKRIVEDMAGISPEAFQAGLGQNYIIANPAPGLDYFINPIQIDYPTGGAVPAGCPVAASLGTPMVDDPVQDSGGNTVAPGAMCVANPDVAGTYGADGKPDGFVNPVRIYKSVQVELGKSFSSGWQWHFNYRWAQLSGNYEGAYRNDNGQSDPSISSLFDFIRGDFNLLGNQFDVGWLNTDRRHIINNFLSYTFANGFAKNLTLGAGVRIETGAPISDLRAHPAYQNAGEIPWGGRGSLGRTPSDGQADIHADYMVKVSEKHRLHFGADLFNITNQTTLLRVDQNQDRSYLVNNADYLKPFGDGSRQALNPGFQRPFYARLMFRWEF